MPDQTRRGFLGALAGIGAVGAGTARVAAAAVPVAPALPYPRMMHAFEAVDARYAGEHLGGDGAYRYHWTGLKGSVDNACLVGQWLAWPMIACVGVDAEKAWLDAPPFLYVNVPGMVGGPYPPGAMFNVSSGGNYILAGTDPSDIVMWIDQGHRQLRALIDEYKSTTVRAMLQGRR